MEELAFTVEHHGPVVVGIAGSRGSGGSVELVVRDSKARAVVVRDDEHAANKRELVVVDPDTVVATLEVKRISTPYYTRVDVGELNALNDNVLCVLQQRETLALQDSFSVNTQDGLVATDLERSRSSSVVGDGADGNVVVRSAARKLAKIKLAATLHSFSSDLIHRHGNSYLGTAALAVAARSGRSLAGEIELLGDKDDASHIVRKVLGKLIRSTRGNSGG